MLFQLSEHISVPPVTKPTTKVPHQMSVPTIWHGCRLTIVLNIDVGLCQSGVNHGWCALVEISPVVQAVSGVTDEANVRLTVLVASIHISVSPTAYWSSNLLCVSTFIFPQLGWWSSALPSWAVAREWITAHLWFPPTACGQCWALPCHACTCLSSIAVGDQQSSCWMHLIWFWWMEMY